VASRWLQSVAGVACAGLLLAGCGGADVDPLQPDQLATSEAGGGGGSAQARPTDPEDTTELVERALAARAANRPAEFAALVAVAAKACPDPSAARRLGDLAAIAARWSSALQDGRPKAQLVAEGLLAKADWDALAAACDAP
jgi:hypothetical protein